MAKTRDIGITLAQYRQMAAHMRQRWRVALYAADPEGNVVFGRVGCPGRRTPGCADARKLAIAEALRWGEPTVQLCQQRRLVWAMPLMRNAAVLGGLIATTGEADVFPQGDGAAAIDVRGACDDLRRLTEEANLTNAAMLEVRREESRREQQRAQGIHDFKLQSNDNIRALYLRDEPELLAAIRRGDRPAAREILNRLLAAILYHAGSRVELVKSFFMELVATMCRSAVEAGGNAEELLGDNFASMAELSRAGSLEDLAPWLHDMLERLMDAIARYRAKTGSAMVADALAFIGEHYARPISRDDAAEAVHLSPSHFSRLLRLETGRTFTEILTRVRVDAAADMLRRTDRSLAMVALDCGFRDQSYFTKVFRKLTRQTPRQYRHQQESE